MVNLKGKRNMGFTIIDKIYVIVVILLAAVIISGWPSYSMEGYSESVIKWAADGDRIPERAVERISQRRFLTWAANPIVVEAIKKANAEPRKSIYDIILLDNAWIDGECAPKFYNKFLENECAQYLQNLRKENFRTKSLYSEIFVMDKQGCIVAQTQKASDYWQGDEDKFVKAYANGKGAVYISESIYDESTQSILIHVSVPVIDGDSGKAIGVMTIGMNINVLDEQI
jgi:hypothetical protein